jgi:hypothetical protein
VCRARVHRSEERGARRPRRGTERRPLGVRATGYLDGLPGPDADRPEALGVQRVLDETPDGRRRLEAAHEQDRLRPPAAEETFVAVLFNDLSAGISQLYEVDTADLGA